MDLNCGAERAAPLVTQSIGPLVPYSFNPFDPRSLAPSSALQTTAGGFEFAHLDRRCLPDDRQFDGEVGVGENVSKACDLSPLNVRLFFRQ